MKFRLTFKRTLANTTSVDVEADDFTEAEVLAEDMMQSRTVDFPAAVPTEGISVHSIHELDECGDIMDHEFEVDVTLFYSMSKMMKAVAPSSEAAARMVQQLLESGKGPEPEKISDLSLHDFEILEVSMAPDTNKEEED